MTDDEWNVISLLLDHGFKWREPFGKGHETSYRVLLDGYDPEQIGGALRQLVARGQVFGPTPGEIVELIRADPSMPTGAEMVTLLYARGGVFKARPPYSGRPLTDSDFEEAQWARAGELHPSIGAFVRTQGLRRLRMLEVDHEVYGESTRRRLLEEWNTFIEANEGRDLAALAAGPARGQLGRFDPLAALPTGPKAAA
jgi:hypothetical protein